MKESLDDFIAWQAEDKNRSVKIEIRTTSEGQAVEIWVYDFNFMHGQFVKSVEEIDIPAQTEKAERRELEKLTQEIRRHGMITEHGMFFDQEDPPVPVIECVAEYDKSYPYEVDSAAIFKTEDGKYIGVTISGCSCWPDRGSTQWSQVVDDPKDLVGFFSDSYWSGDFPHLMKMITNTVSGKE